MSAAVSFTGETALDAVVDQVRRHLRTCDANEWEVAVLLHGVEAGRLWDPAFESFKAFVESKIPDLDYSRAVRLATVGQFSRDNFERFGLRKLYAIGLAPSESQEALLVACNTGKSAVEIERMARAVRPERSRGGRPPTKAVLTKPEPLPPNAKKSPITVKAVVMQTPCPDVIQYITAGCITLSNGKKIGITLVRAIDDVSMPPRFTVDEIDEVES